MSAGLIFIQGLIYPFSSFQFRWWYWIDDRFTATSLLDVVLEVYLADCHADHFGSLFPGIGIGGEQLSGLECLKRNDRTIRMATLVYCCGNLSNRSCHSMDSRRRHMPSLGHQYSGGHWASLVPRRRVTWSAWNYSERTNRIGGNIILHTAWWLRRLMLSHIWPRPKGESIGGGGWINSKHRVSVHRQSDYDHIIQLEILI